MASMSVRLRGIPETEACIGWAGAHSITVDRPEGKAGGQGLGFNGGQLLALAIGGCFCNDLHYIAHDMGIRLAPVALDVTLELEGTPLRATSAILRADIRSADGKGDIETLIRRAEADSTVSNSVSRGFRVTVTTNLQQRLE